MTQYRADIDGLRAIAVLSVVLFHFGVPGFGGGYVGVDIFFTISGYLIGLNIFQDLEKQRFSFSHFYLRRIKRLFPAYFVTIFVTAIIAHWVLLPMDYKQFGQSLAASSVYVSNILFYLEAGYFDTASHFKPLLHTWSLAVEEQFYLVFPILAFALYRFGRRLLLALLVLLTVGSLLSAIIFINYDQSAVFYLYPFRAWEMFIGVLLAGYRPQTSDSILFVRILPALGLGLVTAPIAFYDEHTQFPGAAALAPCLGTLLLIYAGQSRNVVTHPLLCSAPFVFFGKISYSLYLWHWPLFVIYNYSLENAITPLQTTALFAVTVGLSVLSWKFVETPLRQSGSKWYQIPRFTFSSTALLSGCCIILGLILHWQHGLPQRLEPSVARLAAISRGFVNDWSNCYTEENSALPGLAHCAYGNPSQSDNVLLIWGDSHAPTIKDALQTLADEYNADVLLVWRGGCPPIFGAYKDESVSSQIEDQLCTKQNANVLHLLQNASIRTVLLVGRWSYYINGGGVGIDSHNRISLSAVNTYKEQAADIQDQLFAQLFNSTVETLVSMEKDVFILQQFPEFPDYHSRTISKSVMLKKQDLSETIAPFTTMDYAIVRHRQEKADQIFSVLRERDNIRIIPTHNNFCTARSCSVLLDGEPAYYDNNHITSDTSLKLKSLFVPLFTPLSAQR